MHFILNEAFKKLLTKISQTQLPSLRALELCAVCLNSMTQFPHKNNEKLPNYLLGFFCNNK
jgi:hypothetical protein